MAIKPSRGNGTGQENNALLLTSSTTGKLKIPWGPLLLVSTFFALGVFQVAGNISFFQKMWIDERNIEGGPIAWLTEHFDDPVNTFASVAYILANFLMDGTLVSVYGHCTAGGDRRLTYRAQLCRLLLIYDNNFLVIIVPALAFLASTGG